MLAGGAKVFNTNVTIISLGKMTDQLFSGFGQVQNKVPSLECSTAWMTASPSYASSCSLAVLVYHL